MAEKRVSVRLAAVGGDKLRAALVAIGREGKRAISDVPAAASRGTSAGAALGQLEALAARASQAIARLLAAGASTGTLVERIDEVTGVAPRMRRSAEEIAAYGTALDELRARHNPLFAAVRDYRGQLAEIRQAHAVGALSDESMQGAISRERRRRSRASRRSGAAPARSPRWAQSAFSVRTWYGVFLADEEIAGIRYVNFLVSGHGSLTGWTGAATAAESHENNNTQNGPLRLVG